MLSLQVSRAMKGIAAGPARTIFESFLGPWGPSTQPPKSTNLACNSEILVYRSSSGKCARKRFGQFWGGWGWVWIWWFCKEYRKALFHEKALAEMTPKLSSPLVILTLLRSLELLFSLLEKQRKV